MMDIPQSAYAKVQIDCVIVFLRETSFCQPERFLLPTLSVDDLRKDGISPTAGA